MISSTARGIFLLCLGVFAFSTQDVIVKHVSGSYPLTEVVCIRSCVGLPLLWWLMQREPAWKSKLAGHLRPLALRGALMLCSYLAYYMAFPALPLADAVGLYFTVPLFVTVLAGPLLGERVLLRVWLAVVLGFVGVAIMLQPGAHGFEPAALLSLLAAALYAGGMLMARKLGEQLPSVVMAFYQNCFFLVGPVFLALGLDAMGVVQAAHPSLLFLVRPWLPLTSLDALMIGACGLIAAVGTILLTAAYRSAPSNLVAPFEYTGILWAPLWGIVFFSEVPKTATLAGAVTIGAAGLLAMHAGRAAR